VPMEATAMPFPTELTTPPVTKIYFDIKKLSVKVGKTYEGKSIEWLYNN
jgi:hypothetical protein